MSNVPSQPQAGAAGDPLASLHKMSRTAGLGGDEYVAVNNTAVVALLLGLASSLAIFGTLLLVIPVLACVVAIVAIRQINHSAGTQTGKGLAWSGLILAIAFVLLVGGREVQHLRQVRRQQDQIVALVRELGGNLNRADYEAAWRQFSPRFQQRVRKEDFVAVWTQHQTSPYYGQIRSMGLPAYQSWLPRWLWPFSPDVILDVQMESGVMMGRGILIVELPEGRIDRRGATFRKLPQQGWVIDDLEGYFDAVAAKSR